MEEIAEIFILNEIEFKKKEELNINILYENDLFKKIAFFAKDANEGARIITYGLKLPLDRAINPLIFKGQFGTFKLDFHEDENNDPIFTLTRCYSNEDIEKTISLSSKILSNTKFSDEIFNKEEIQEFSKCLEQLKTIQSQEQFEQNVKYIEKSQELVLKSKMRSKGKQIEKRKSWINWFSSLFKKLIQVAV